MATGSEVVAHHKLLCQDLLGALPIDELALVEVGQYQDWQRANWPRTIFFELKKGKFHEKLVELDEQDPMVLVEFVPDFAQPKANREKGGPATVFKLCDLDGGISLWASWSEEWRSFAADQYGLVGGAWCFFFRIESGPFTQLFRAEWDQLLLPDGSKGRGGKAGQPHWHVDLRAEVIHESSVTLRDDRPGVGSSLREIIPEEPLQSLEPLKSTTSNSLYRSGVHLGMAATRENGAIESWKWQIQVDHELSRLRSWSTATLLYVKDEATHLKLS